MAYAFNSVGSNPGVTNTSTPNNAIGNPSIFKGIGNVLSGYSYGGNNQSAPITMGNNAGLISHPTAPKSTVASHTVTTNPDGSVTTKQTYVPPASAGTTASAQTSTTAPSQTQNTQNTSGGPIGPTASGPNYAPQSTDQNAPGYVAPNPVNQGGSGVNYNSSNPYPGLIQNLANQGGTPYNTTATGAISGLLGSLPNNQAIGQNIQNIENQAGQQIANIGGLGARSEAGQLTTGTSPVAEGNAAITAQTTAAQQQAIQQGAQTALQGTQQALTAQGQTQSGFQNAAGQALTGQQLGQSALGTATGYAAPASANQVITPGQTAYNAATGQQLGGINQNVISSIVNGIKGENGMTYDQAVSALGAYANDPNTVAALRDSLQTNIPGYNIPAQSGQAAAQQQLTQTGGTAAQTASNQVYQTATQNLANYQNMASNISSFGSQLLNNMDQLGIRSNSQLANKTLNQLASQFSSPQYAQFNANLQGLQARVAALLGTGEIPTSATAGAEGIVNGNITGAAMQSTLNQINNEANAIVQNQAQIAQNAYKNVTGGSSSNSSGSSGGGWGSLGD